MKTLLPWGKKALKSDLAEVTPELRLTILNLAFILQENGSPDVPPGTEVSLRRQKFGELVWTIGKTLELLPPRIPLDARFIPEVILNTHRPIYLVGPLWAEIQADQSLWAFDMELLVKHWERGTYESFCRFCVIALRATRCNPIDCSL